MQLHHELLELRRREKQIGSEILSKLQIMEKGRQYIGMGYSSLFDYLVRGLGYSESAAYQKHSCLKLTQELPEIKAKLDKGTLSTSGLSMAFKTLKNKSLSEKRVIISKIENKPSREIKKILVEVAGEEAPPIKIQKPSIQTKWSFDWSSLRSKIVSLKNSKL